MDLIDSFPNHPYHVFDDVDMEELVASIKANGLLNPIVIRNEAAGWYHYFDFICNADSKKYSL